MRNGITESFQLFISRFEKYFDVILGLNEKEAFEVAAVLGVARSDESAEGLGEMAREMQRRLRVNTLVVHPVRYALAVSGNTLYAGGAFTRTFDSTVPVVISPGVIKFSGNTDRQVDGGKALALARQGTRHHDQVAVLNHCRTLAHSVADKRPFDHAVLVCDL